MKEETRIKLKASINRLWANPEYRKMQSEAHKNSIHTKEQKKKISEGLKRAYRLGRKRHWIGKKFSLEHRLKISTGLENYHKITDHEIEASEWTYREKALRYYGIFCQVCKKKPPEKRILVHHKDGNHKNHKIENLQPLCTSCHMNQHPKLKLKRLLSIKANVEKQIAELEAKIHD